MILAFLKFPNVYTVLILSKELDSIEKNLSVQPVGAIQVQIGIFTDI